MVQDQLVEYISAQMKAGVSRDSIKNTLVSAGWQAADVEDTLKKIESTKTSQPITAASSAMGAVGSGVAAKPAATSQSQPTTMKMSDLISTSDSAATTVNASTTSGSTNSNSQKVFTGGAKPTENKFNVSGNQYPPKTGSSHGALITEVILGILIILIGALAGYFYFENGSLSSQLATAKTAGTDNSLQLAAMQQSFNATTTALNSQIAALSGQNQELQTELSFYATPTGAPNTNATTTGSISGIVSGGGKTPYLITATYGAKVYVTNSKDPTLSAELAPLVASSTSATFTGTYLPGSDTMTVTDVKAD